eukprot:6532057-Alexandrium_andersonii.AAC.1
MPRGQTTDCLVSAWIGTLNIDVRYASENPTPRHNQWHPDTPAHAFPTTHAPRHESAMWQTSPSPLACTNTLQPTTIWEQVRCE